MHGEHVEAKKYVGKVANELKVKYYVKLKMLEQAVQFAFEQKDLDALLYIKNNCGSSGEAIMEKLNSYISQLSKRSKIFWAN